jgi:hypothetical protein
MRKRRKVEKSDAALRGAIPRWNSYLLLIIPSRNDKDRREFRKRKPDAMASTDGSGESFRR